jgi:PAS domain S-box-containing protein
MNLNISTGTVFDRVALICGAISICIGGVGLVGWAVGLRVLTAVRLDYIPMAPNTGLIVILLGCALFSGIAWSRNRTIRIAIAGISFLCIIVAGLTLIGIVIGIDLKIDYLLLTTTGTIGTVPVGHMSPVTAICFLLGSAALLLFLFKKNHLVSLLGTVIALIGGVMLIGYWYGAPLLYGGTIIPVALTTAVALGVLGVGLNAAVGSDSWLLSSVIGTSTRARLLRGLLPVILVLVLIMNWINVVILGHADSSVVLSSAVTVILSLLVVYVVVTYASREIGDTIDRSEENRKKAEEALHESEEVRYRRLFETAQDGILILDGESGEITDANPFLLTLLGYTSDEILGKKLWEIGVIKDKALAEQAAVDLKKTGYIRYEDLPLEAKDGRVIDVEFVSNLYVVNHTRVIQCSIRNITERKKAEAEIARKHEELTEAYQSLKIIQDKIHELNAELEQRVIERTDELTCSNRDLQQFAYVASHDLQEPLRVISNFVQLLKKRYKGKFDKDADEFMDFIDDSSIRMQKLIQDLLTFSRLETRGEPFNAVDVNGVVDEVIKDLQITIDETGAVVTHDPLPMVTADRSQLFQLFLNLTQNALKFRKEKEPPKIHISAVQIDREWIFSVRDNGIGIEPQYYEKIFIIFQQLHSRGKYPGTGMGLAIAKRIIERHRGKIWVESELGRGSIVFFSLPVDKEV